jgi:hypothetical protein
MIKIERFVACALFLAAALVIPAVSIGQNPFSGTWRTNFDQSKISQKPNIYYLSGGWYHCVSCTPSFDVQADGQDHPVTGQSYDTINVSTVNDKSVSIVTKKGGVVVSESTRTVSPNGKTLTVKSTYHPMNGGPAVTSEITATRVGADIGGAHASSGSWRIDKIHASDNDLFTTYKQDGDQLTMTEPTGESYTAQLDGKDYPVKGAYSYNAVSLKRIDKNTVEETDKRDGQVTDVSKMTISPDGKKMTVVETNKQSDRTSTYVAIKQ